MPERQSPAARADRSAFPWRAFAPLGALVCFTMLVFYLIPTRLPFFLAAIGIESPSAAGVAIVAVTLAGIPGSFWFGRIRARFAAMTVAWACFLIVAVGFVLISLADSLPGVVLGTFVVGAGLGPAIPNLLAWLMASMPDEAKGRASGYFTVALFGGQFLSPLVAQAVSGRVGLARTFDAFAAALAAMAIALFVLGRLGARRAGAARG